MKVELLDNIGLAMARCAGQKGREAMIRAAATVRRWRQSRQVLQSMGQSLENVPAEAGDQHFFARRAVSGMAQAMAGRSSNCSAKRSAAGTADHHQRLEATVGRDLQYSDHGRWSAGWSDLGCTHSTALARTHRSIYPYRPTFLRALIAAVEVIYAEDFGVALGGEAARIRLIEARRSVAMTCAPVIPPTPWTIADRPRTSISAPMRRSSGTCM